MNKMDVCNFLAVLFILVFSGISAQQKESFSVFYSTSAGMGTGNFKGTKSNFSSSHQLGISKKLNPEEAEWIRFLNAENISVSLLYSDLDEIETDYFTYGKSYGAISEIDFRLLQKGNFKLFFTPGFGLTYVTKTAFNDTTTYIFGSHINAVFSAALKPEIRFAEDLSLYSNISFLHYSNGSVQIPNAGINVVNVGLGIKKDFQAGNSEIKAEEKDFKKNGIEIAAGAGVRGKYRIKDNVFRMGFYAGYNRFINRVLGFRIGLDASYYGETYDPENYQDTGAYIANSWDPFRIGASVGTEVKMGKFAANANFGRYLHFNNPNGQKTYWNAGMKYYLAPNFGVQGVLNVHKFQADYVNWGIFTRF